MNVGALASAFLDEASRFKDSPLHSALAAGCVTFWLALRPISGTPGIELHNGGSCTRLVSALGISGGARLVSAAAITTYMQSG